MSRKSETCVGSQSSKSLTEYDSKMEAQEGADYANQRYHKNLIPYQCNRCGLWHLAPESRQTPSAPCQYCRGKDGKPKASYQSKDDAERRAGILRKEQGVSLKVYPCKHGSGWHLTNTGWHWFSCKIRRLSLRPSTFAIALRMSWQKDTVFLKITFRNKPSSNVEFISSLYSRKSHNGYRRVIVARIVGRLGRLSPNLSIILLFLLTKL